MKGTIRKRGSSYQWQHEAPPGWGKLYVTGTARLKKDAQAALTASLDECAKGRAVEPTIQLATDYLADWLELRKLAVKPSTWRSDSDIVRLHIGPALSGLTPTGAGAQPTVSPNATAPRSSGGGSATATGGAAGDTEGDAELVVSRDVVGRCPTVRLVREHVDEFDPDLVWLAVLESIAECMSDDGPMAGQSIAVSGDDDHRHVVSEVLASRGVAATRVVTQPTSRATSVTGSGAAECQGDTDCNKRVEITIVGP